ncbi:hypothetical protein PENTCL1PPCAC_7692, partial [Pristionchus entomophagus]
FILLTVIMLRLPLLMLLVAAAAFACAPHSPKQNPPKKDDPPPTKPEEKCDSTKIMKTCEDAKLVGTPVAGFTTSKPTEGTDGGLKCDGTQQLAYYARMIRQLWPRR